MLVCRHWHDVGIRDTSLWSFVDALPVDLHKKMVQIYRSGLHPLNVKFSGTLHHKHVLHVLEPHTSRIQELYITGTVEYIFPTLCNLAQYPLPSLKSFKVCPFTESQEAFFCLPDAFLTGTSLQSVALTDMAANWELLDNLVELRLTHNPKGSVEIPSFEELVSLLRRSPALRMLELRSFISPRLDNKPLVNLPRLESLDVTDKAERCESLLSVIVVPATASLRISSPDISQIQHIGNLLDSLGKHYRCPSAHTMRLLRIRSEDMSTKISTYPSTSSTDSLPHHEYAYMSLEFRPANHFSCHLMIEKILQELPVESITHLDTQLVTEFTRSSRKMTLSLLPNLHTLILEASSTSVEFNDALLELMDSPTHPFPRLRCIQFQCEGERRWTHSWDVFLDSLTTVVTRYKEVGAPIETLHINRCWFHSSSIERYIGVLYVLVGTLYLDGNIYFPVNPETMHPAQAYREGLLQIGQGQ